MKETRHWKHDTLDIRLYTWSIECAPFSCSTWNFWSNQKFLVLMKNQVFLAFWCWSQEVILIPCCRIQIIQSFDQATPWALFWDLWPCPQWISGAAWVRLATASSQSFFQLLDYLDVSCLPLQQFYRRDFGVILPFDMSTAPEFPETPPPANLPENEKILLVHLRDRLATNDALKCQVLEMNSLVVRPGKGKANPHKAGVCVANIHLLWLFAPSIKQCKALKKIDRLNWLVLALVVEKWKAIPCHIFLVWYCNTINYNVYSLRFFHLGFHMFLQLRH